MHRIILDTNILSELFRPDPNRFVMDWLSRQDPQKLTLTVFTLAEIHAGINNLPVGKKRSALTDWLNDYVLPNFEGRILSFDSKAAAQWGHLIATQKKQGRPLPTIDAMIAAIALSQKTTLATRNTKDFKTLPLTLINPFEQQK